MERAVFPWLLLCLVFVSGVGCLTVIIPEKEYEHARGDNITLPCSFQSKVAKPSLVVISWSVEAEKETSIVTYYSHTGRIDIKQVYEHRVSLDVDVAQGKANLNLNSITLKDNEVFECRVMIPGDDEGTPADTVRLVVLVAPSPPICEVQGKAQYGQNINLTCFSEEGSPPPTYGWERRDVRNMPSPHDPRTTDKKGILSLYNISRDTSGFYLCTSRNKIRSATCNLTLTVLPPSMLGSVGSTAAIIGGVVAGVIALIIIIYCCCCRKKNKEEEYAMGVREEGNYDKDSVRNGENRRPERPEDMRSDDESSVRGYSERQDRYEDRSDRDYDRRRDYDDRRSDYDDRRSDYDDRRSEYSDRQYSDRHERYDDNRRYDDDRRYNERRDRRYDDDDRRYDEPRDERPPRRDYDD